MCALPSLADPPMLKWVCPAQACVKSCQERVKTCASTVAFPPKNYQTERKSMLVPCNALENPFFDDLDPDQILSSKMDLDPDQIQFIYKRSRS